MKHFFGWIIVAIIIVAFLLLTTVILTVSFGQICWLPRLGALLVGIAVSIMAWNLFDLTNTTTGFDPDTTNMLKIRLAVVLTLLGIVLWAFGDLIPEIGGIQVCA